MKVGDKIILRNRNELDINHLVYLDEYLASCHASYDEISSKVGTITKVSLLNDEIDITFFELSDSFTFHEREIQIVKYVKTNIYNRLKWMLEDIYDV